MTTTETVVDATVIEDGQAGAELVHQPAAPANLFRTDDPAEVVSRASAVADALKGVLVKQKLTSTISGREYVRVEGLQTVATMVGLTPVTTGTRRLDNGFEATCEVRTLDGRVVGAATAMCTRDERTWAKRDDYALLSMAQTRATAKALRSVLAFVVSLAGYETTPAEEMPHQDTEPTGPVFGPAFSGDKAQLMVTLERLVGDHEQAMAVARTVASEAGYMPAVVARALQRAESARRAHNSRPSDIPVDVGQPVADVEAEPTEEEMAAAEAAVENAKQEGLL